MPIVIVGNERSAFCADDIRVMQTCFPILIFNCAYDCTFSLISVLFGVFRICAVFDRQANALPQLPPFGQQIPNAVLAEHAAFEIGWQKTGFVRLEILPSERTFIVFRQTVERLPRFFISVQRVGERAHRRRSRVEGFFHCPDPFDSFVFF